MKAIVGGLLIDGTGCDPVRNATVIVDEEGRIVQAGKMKTLPREAEVIDASGKTIMPGLIDSHVHLVNNPATAQERLLAPVSFRILQGMVNAKTTLDMGITAVRDAFGAPLGFRQAAERGMFPSPRLRISVVPLTQTGGHGDDTHGSGIRLRRFEMMGPEWPEWICDGENEVRKVARLVLRAGADFVKIVASGGVMSPNDEVTSPQFTREEITAIVYEARVAGKTCMAHAQSIEGIRNAVECGVESIEHGFHLDESLVEAMKVRGTFLVPTLVAPIWVLRRTEEKPESVLPQAKRKATEVIKASEASFRLAVESGVRIARGTDTAVGPHGTNNEELRLMVEYGMTPMQTIVAATKTAAECIHMDQDIGTLEPGKLADLLVVDGNPLDNIGILEDKSKLLLIMQGGKIYKNLVTSL